MSIIRFGTPARWNSSLYRFDTFCNLLLVLATLATLFFFAEALSFLPVNGENMYPESAGVLAAKRWGSGLPLYEDYRQSPYLMTAFPPLWYLSIGIAAKAGLSDLDALTLLGRFLSMASLIGVALLAYIFNRRFGFSLRLALLAPTFYLSFPVLIPWAVTARPDFPALVVSGLALFWACFRSGRNSLLLSGGVAAIAFLVRHNAVAVPVAVVLWLLWSRRWKDTGTFCAAWIAVAGVSLAVFQIASGGLMFLNLSGAKFGPIAITYVRDVLQRLLISEGSGFGLALFVFGVFMLLDPMTYENLRTRLLAIYVLVSLGFATLGSAAAGGAANHYLEAAFGIAILVPHALARLEASWQQDASINRFAMLSIFAVLLPSLDVQRWNVMHRKPENLRRVAALLQNREVFTDDPYLAARSSTPGAIDLASLINTERAGGAAAWSSDRLADKLQMKEYELVILRTPLDSRSASYNPVALYPRTPRLDSALEIAIIQNYSLCVELNSGDGYGSVYVYSPVIRNSSDTGICPAVRVLVEKPQS